MSSNSDAAGSRRPQGPNRIRLRPSQIAFVGVVGGVLSGLLGVGGGIVMVPLLVLWGGVSQRNAHALSLGAIIPISAASVAVFGAAGEVRVLEAAALAVGSIAGARVGAGILIRARERPLKLAFGVTLVVVALAMVVAH